MFSLTSNEKLQLSLFKLMDKKAVYSLQQDCCDSQDIQNTKYQCIFLAVRKMCQVYEDLQDSSSQQSCKLKALIWSYLKIIYHSKIDKKVRVEILKFLKTPTIENCDKIICAIYDLDIEDFSLYIFSNLISHINKGNPRRNNLFIS